MVGWKFTKKLFDHQGDDEHMDMNKNHDDIVCNSSSHIDSGDLIVEILLRLPPNSVHLFRRVCKQWYSLISDLDFIRTHAINDHHLLVSISKLRPFKGLVDFVHVPNYIDEEDRKPDPLFVPLELFPTSLLRNYQLIDSSNGLLLFCDNNAISDHQNLNGANYYVTNPITKCYFKLPTMIPIPNIKPEEKQELKLLNSPRHATLVFEPSVSLSYKVIRYLIPGTDLDEMQIYVYSSETRSWRVLRERISNPMHTHKPGFRSVVLNGVLYWSYWMTKADDLVCFDVEKECVWFLPLPPSPAPSYDPSYDRIRNCLNFGRCGGRLQLIERILGRRDFHVMETEPQPQQHQNRLYHTWTVKYRVNIGTVCHCIPFVIHSYRTKNRRGESEEEEEDVLLLKLTHDRTIVSFSLTNNKLKNDEIITIPESLDLCDFEDMFAYKPTFFPVS